MGKAITKKSRVGATTKLVSKASTAMFKREAEQRRRRWVKFGSSQNSYCFNAGPDSKLTDGGSVDIVVHNCSKMSEAKKKANMFLCEIALFHAEVR